MGKKIVTAIGSDVICSYLTKKRYEVVNDIPYQDGVLEFVKKEFADIIILSSDLSGDYDKYIFIEKIREIDSKIKLIVIVGEMEDNYKSFLYSKGIFHIFTDGKSLMGELISAIEDNDLALEDDLRQKNMIDIKRYRGEDKTSLNKNLTLKFQRQQIITFAGIGSSGKTTIASCFAKILAKKTSAKVLLIDLDIVNAGINRFLGVKKEPEDPGYILGADKNSSLNYMVDAIDKRNFNANIFNRYIVKSKMYPNLDVLTGNRSLYVCKNILSSEYYLRILESAKAIYDYIIIDTSGNIFLDSMQLSLLNSTKVFVVAEGNYISLERTTRLLTELFSVWGVPDKKVEIIINKYSLKSLDKTIIKELLNNYAIAGYIKFSEKYEELINSINPKLSKDIEEQYYFLLEKAQILERSQYKAKDRRIIEKILSFRR